MRPSYKSAVSDAETGHIDNSRAALTCIGPPSMRRSLSRPEQDECGISQPSIQHHPRSRSAMSDMRLLPFKPAASQCARANLGMQPGSRCRS